MEFLMYIELNVTCLVIVSFILMRLHERERLKASDWLFSILSWNIAILCILDLVWAFVDKGDPALRPLNALLSAGYLIEAVAIALIWLWYTESCFSMRARKNRLLIILSLLPLVVFIFLTVISAGNGCVFTVDEYNVYHRGPLHILQPAFGFAYLAWASLHALYKAIHAKNYAEKADCYTLASFVIIPVIGTIIQQFLYGLPTANVSVTLSLLYVFITIRDRQISLDPLTQLNNRHQLKKYLSDKLASHYDGRRLFLLMMDIDKFKEINDMYGHVEGDQALIQVALALKQACGLRNAFIARYGGDEFIIVYEVKSDTELEGLKEHICQVLDENQAAIQAPYRLRLSIGMAEYAGPPESMVHFIARADADLYRFKDTHGL